MRICLEGGPILSFAWEKYTILAENWLVVLDYELNRKLYYDKTDRITPRGYVIFEFDKEIDYSYAGMWKELKRLNNRLMAMLDLTTPESVLHLQ
jgi:hypothetical protein